MLSMKTVIRDFGGSVCRRCINKQYHLDLQPRDCRYQDPYPRLCPNCKEMHHIVGGFSFTGKLKTLIQF